MSVAFARALAAGVAAHGVPVTWEPGAETRGNGQVSHYQGLVVHHTAGQSLDRITSDLRDGRKSPPLAGPLCNSAGLHSGGLHIIAAHPANHAGASGGKDTAPLPVTGLFNREVWGHEVMYPGTRPMSPAQWRTAAILGAVVCRLTGHDYDPRWVKLHQGTSVTGKWDAGNGPGSTYPIAELRAAVLVVMKGQHMPLTVEDADLVVTRLLDRLIGLRGPSDELTGEASVAMVLARLGGDHLPARLMGYPVPNYERTRPDGSLDTEARTTLGAQLGWADAHVDAVVGEVRKVGRPDAAALARDLALPLAAELRDSLGAGGLTVEQVEGALRNVLRSGVDE